MRRLFTVSLALVCTLWCTQCVSPQDTEHQASLKNLPRKYAVASAHPLATQAGLEILKQGGNAFDAAIAVTASLAVVEPYASGLGGGGFYLLHLADTNQNVMLDARETAPLAASREMYLNETGEVTEGSIQGALAAGIPGIPAAIVHLSDHYARMPLHTSLQSAIQLAREGFVIDERYRKLAKAAFKKLSTSTEAAKIFLHQNQVPDKNFVLQQPELANALRKIRDHGLAGFYQGVMAERLVTSVQNAGGIWQKQDLLQYKVKERKPITGHYQGIDIISATLPSSGGIVLMQILNMLSEYDLLPMQETQRVHLIVEAMRRAYRDRANYLGDSDFVKVPIEILISRKYAKQNFSDFNSKVATTSSVYLQNGNIEAQTNLEEGKDTTHFSIIDQEGNYVAATLSINYYFGSGFVPEGTGILLNNEMDDFVVKPGHANLWGLVGSEANAIEPGKRMLSSMSPTFLIDNQRTAIFGTPGGSRIISMVMLSTLAFAQDADARTMVTLPRYHHQFLPDQIQYEVNRFNETTLAALMNMGHSLQKMDRKYGNMQVVIWDRLNNTVTAASDPRGIGRAGLGE